MKIGKIPRWYQDLSIHQMELITSLKNVIKADYEENVTGKSKRLLMDIGITSTFIKLSSKEIRKLQIKSNLDPVKFLCEIYKFITGSYFQDEPYRKSYSCNERIILTSIAFLKLPEILLELHQRLPMGKIQEYPKKPSPPMFITRVKKTGSPYLDSTFSEPPDWGLYKSNLQKWYELKRSQIQPQIILPQCLQIKNDYSIIEENHTSPTSSSSFVTVTTKQSQQEVTEVNDYILDDIKSKSITGTDDYIDDELKTKSIGEISKTTGAPSSLTTIVSKIDEENLIDNKINEEKKDNIVLKKLKKQKSIGNNNDDYIKEKSIDKIYKKKKKHQQNINENIENSKQKKQQNKIIKENLKNEITIKNSLEKYDYLYNRLSRLDNYEKKIFPPGRENLSLNWKEWFVNVETEFYYLEKVANKMIDNVREVTQKIFPVDVCDGCCACRQQNKHKKDYRESKIPNIVIDNITTGETGKRYIVSSLVLNSPPESLSGSSLNEPFVVPSEDKLVNKSIINSVIMQNDKIKYQMSGITKQIQHIPKRLIPKVPIIKNIVPCECKNEERSLEFYENEKLTCVDGDDDVCIGKKFPKTSIACRECTDKFKNNEIFIKFEKICRQNDKKYEEEMEKIKLARQPKQPPQEIPIENKLDEEIVKCKKCIGCDEDKCKPNPFDNLLKQKKLENEVTLTDGKKYRDNIKISVGGSIRRDDDEMNCFILSGVSLQTPIEVTPEPSEPDVESIKSMSKHHHWSVTKFNPKYQKEFEDDYETDEIINDDTIKTINNDKTKSDIASLNDKEIHENSKKIKIKKTNELKNHDDNIHHKEKKKNNHKHKKKIDKDSKKISINKEEKKSSLNSLINDEIVIKKNDFKEKENVFNDNTNDEIKKKEFKEKVNFLDNDISGEIKKNEFSEKEIVLNDNMNEEIKKNSTIENLKINPINKIDNSNLFKENNDDVGDGNLSTMMKIALNEMAEEGYLFAKLPACHEIPPLKIWIMYRKGFKTSDKKNNEYLENMEKLFDSSDKDSSNKLEAPQLKLSDDKKKQLNHKTLSKLTKKIDMKKIKFFSDTRQHRVNESRKMWNLLEQGQVPCATDKFKKIFFTYQPSKESEGFILKPYGLESE